MKLIQSWGRLEPQLHQIFPLSSPEQSKIIVKQHRPGLAIGNGRSYGDVCLNPGGILWSTLGLDNFCAWDSKHGRLTCEAGVLLKDIQKTFVPRGWILPVTPGTQLITVGGAIANDIHGKNHHAFGTFGDNVTRLWLLRTDGQEIECSKNFNADWFEATVGGLGLTGLITKAQIQLKTVNSPWLETQTIPFNGLEDFFSLSDSSESEWEHTVSWIDCLTGADVRGIFMRANPSAITQGKERSTMTKRMFFTPPVPPMNRPILRAFNFTYYWAQRAKPRISVAHYESFFYPLDGLLEWNRIYGPDGFYQYQSVIPRETGLDATREMLREISHSGEGSFLAVLKTFGERRAPGILSFARPGVTLALDFPNRKSKTLSLFSRLDSIVKSAGGALYLAKDARMDRNMFTSTYPDIDKFLNYRDPGITSSMSRRLLGN